ncbi:hypothetical protein ADK67_20600 [Saccharothrix sp. NRRL B-16348]|jgi:hypothetical protein|uniref:hypothetical protein n=1 Tax=Saccharothrix sp. NRRL B-16348 TaxID=1415542 RepID=UPI0006AE6F11|nr:hypothetical protein [Saccharothrix sp. NRRL B-16348]KOX23477.1 hypothetical protein ADK67_20600 [Saccharothrix sp. NRRL B-16348]
MRKPGIFLAALAMVIGSLAVPTTAAAASNNCNHEQGGVALPRSADSLEGGIGSVQLCIDSSKRVWAYVVLYQPMPAGRWGNVWLRRYYEGFLTGEFSCNGEPGGNGYVKPGQTRCWTPKVAGSEANVEFKALSWVYRGTYPNEDWSVAFGMTLACSAATGACRDA